MSINKKIGTEDTVDLLTLGDSQVGKTSLNSRYANEDKFSTAYVATIGVDNQKIITKIDEREVLVRIWDTAGQERYGPIPKKYYKNADGIILVYDITNYGKV
mmetsp:Transcript_12704/g.11263  ORF Transcript_12704/g.11263 Transcript_12704/m.11263 type:complete len:102 (+) Transcript_12704:13-318(+)